MTSFKKILVTTDFSDPSLLGVKEAERLAKALSSELLLLHVVTTEPPPELDRASKQRIMIDRRQKARRSLEEQFLDPDSGVDTRILVAAGVPEDEILLVAGDEAVDLVVMASHGRSALGRLFLGSVAQAVLQGATCPVLIVPFRKGRED